MTSLAVVPIPTFEFFWEQHPRKIAKKDAMQAWRKLTAEQQAKACEAVCLWKPIWLENDLCFCCYPATWLNGWRFDDELPQQAPAKPVNWRATDAGVLGMGKECGILPRPGEQMGEYAERVEQAVRLRRTG
jgi:hypothetical protein